ncbi:MAG: hypothetical protein GY778_20375 [bacterium]|nr:hypothetical protein [bacterium]
MNKIITATLATTLLTGAASAQVTFRDLGPIYGLDISVDGSVIVGNLPGVYETFWWTEATGAIPLGRHTGGIGVGAGTPDVSDDGTAVSATIVDNTGTLATQGRWDISTGWQETMPPTPPDGGIMDSAYGSAWGLSGDGQTLVGLYWRPGQPGGSANACYWTQATGVISLGSGGGSSRANDANYDGSVIVGWDEDPSFGTWWPTVWVNGVRTTLTQTVGFADAAAVTPDGTMIVGSSWEVPNQPWHPTQAAAWRWNGSTWDEELLGALPGTTAPFGLAVGNDVTSDGSLVIGYNRRSGPTDATGFMWTAATGIIDVRDYLADHGVVVDPEYDIRTLTAITDDGTRMVGIGQQLVAPFAETSFIIDVCRSTDTGHDGDEDGDVDLGDLALLQQCFTDAGAGTIPPGCAPFDTDCDLDVDLMDYTVFATNLNGPA